MDLLRTKLYIYSLHQLIKGEESLSQLFIYNAA